MELPTFLDQPLQGQIVCARLNMFLPVGGLYLLTEREPLVPYKSQLFVGSFHEMYNCTKHHTGTAFISLRQEDVALEKENL